MNDIPAFPRPSSGVDQYAQTGMTLRDYFAAAVLNGFLTGDRIDIPHPESFAKWCYEMADAMMKAREA